VNRESQALAKIGLTACSENKTQMDIIKQYFERILRNLNRLEKQLKNDGNQVSQD